MPEIHALRLYHSIVLKQTMPEGRVLMVPSAGDVGPTDGLLGNRQVGIQCVADMIARHDHEARLVPRGHDAQAARLEIELTGVGHT